ncbi:Phototropin-2 [Lachnellula arida]|uniref:Phototropin-2 n=1 Tax=Lachnellula arida TaxID=1316785 RepID=A0A8T9B3L8_9HELO|nr:Phototropin-2 [Lachnellula arida]
MDWGSIKRNFRVQSGRFRERTKRRQAQTSAPEVPRSEETEESSFASRASIVEVSDQQRIGNTSRRSKMAGAGEKKSPPVSKQKTTKGKIHGTPSIPRQVQQEQQIDGNDDNDDFDLRPPTLSKSTPVDDLSKSVFSAGHLDTILHNRELFSRFVVFLNRYRPQIAPVLIKYLETQKAMKAVDYANAVAESIADPDKLESEEKTTPAAEVNALFKGMGQGAFDKLLSEALPAYITFNLVKVTTEIMINEITSMKTPVMEGLTSGLSETFCFVDPNQHDSPIIYASEEFYKLTGYSSNFVIGINCRFLQGEKTEQHSVRRLRQATDEGQELSEALLNYRRDGSPFINLLMIAPLHDDKGRVKYYIGAQVDVSGLVEGGKGLESFEQYLSEEQRRGRCTTTSPSVSTDNKSNTAKQNALSKLGELSDLFDLEETGVVAERSYSRSISSRTEATKSTSVPSKQRRILIEPSDDESEDANMTKKERAAWSLSQNGRSGKLPGVYESYFLMRPSPSLKIIFVSPALQEMGNLVQSPLLSHVTASRATLNGLKQSFASGNPVTAKVLFKAEASGPDDGLELSQEQSEKKLEDSASREKGRWIWISATPLMDSDDNVGVWMVVVIDSNSLGSAANSQNRRQPQDAASNVSETPPSGSSTFKDAGSQPDSCRATLNTPHRSKSNHPTYIEIPEHQSPTPQRGNDDMKRNDKLDIESTGDIPRSTPVKSDVIPVGGSAATPGPLLHPRTNSMEPREDETQSTEEPRNDSPVINETDTCMLNSEVPSIPTSPASDDSNDYHKHFKR